MRITTSIVMFYVWFTAGANLLESTGLADAMGVTTSTSAAQKLNNAVNALGDVTGGGVAADSLIGVYTVITESIAAFGAGLTAGPRIMSSLGIPIEIVLFLHAPVALFAARLGIYALSGRDL